MTATEKLRQLLDERGVKWDYGITGATTTKYNVNGVDITFTPMRDGLTCSTILTPEQAIDATLGRGTCRLVPTRDKPRSKAPTLTCSECGWWTADIGATWNYCPNCGRRVVDE